MAQNVDNPGIIKGRLAQTIRVLLSVPSQFVIESSLHRQLDALAEKLKAELHARENDNLEVKIRLLANTRGSRGRTSVKVLDLSSREPVKDFPYHRFQREVIAQLSEMKRSTKPSFVVVKGTRPRPPHATLEVILGAVYADSWGELLSTNDPGIVSQQNTNPPPKGGGKPKSSQPKGSGSAGEKGK